MSEIQISDYTEPFLFLLFMTVVAVGLCKAIMSAYRTTGKVIDKKRNGVTLGYTTDTKLHRKYHAAFHPTPPKHHPEATATSKEEAEREARQKVINKRCPATGEYCRIECVCYNPQQNETWREACIRCTHKDIDRTISVAQWNETEQEEEA